MTEPGFELQTFPLPMLYLIRDKVPKVIPVLLLIIGVERPQSGLRVTGIQRQRLRYCPIMPLPSITATAITIAPSVAGTSTVHYPLKQGYCYYQTNLIFLAHDSFVIQSSIHTTSQNCIITLKSKLPIFALFSICVISVKWNMKLFRGMKEFNHEFSIYFWSPFILCQKHLAPK